MRIGWKKEEKQQCNGMALSNPSSCARHTVRPNKPRHWSLEQRKVYRKDIARRMGGSCSKDLNSLMGFREEVFIGKICGGEL